VNHFLFNPGWTGTLKLETAIKFWNLELEPPYAPTFTMIPSEFAS